MKERMMYLLKKLGKTLSTIIQNIKVSTELKKQEVEHQKLLLEKQMFISKCNQHFADIPNEMFLVMGNKHYPFIQGITATSDFFPCSFRATPQGVLYIYNVIATQSPAKSQLIQLKQILNNDIYMTQKQLLLQMSYQNACMLYPHITHGLYVMDIVPNGMFLQIMISSHFF